jgi:hypothetical protein
MKKIFVASVFLGLASMAQAAFIQCTPAQGTVVNDASPSSQEFTCSPGTGGAGTSDDNVSGDGLNVISISLRVTGTFQENSGDPGEIFTVVFSSTNSLVAPQDPGDPGCTATDAADSNNQALANCVSTTATLGIPATDFINTFTVTVNGNSNGGGDSLPFNASASVFYEVTTEGTTPPPTIPEPSTYAMIGAGLVSLFVIRRRS